MHGRWIFCPDSPRHQENLCIFCVWHRPSVSGLLHKWAYHWWKVSARRLLLPFEPQKVRICETFQLRYLLYWEGHLHWVAETMDRHQPWYDSKGVICQTEPSLLTYCLFESNSLSFLRCDELGTIALAYAEGDYITETRRLCRITFTKKTVARLRILCYNALMRYNVMIRCIDPVGFPFCHMRHSVHIPEASDTV